MGAAARPGGGPGRNRGPGGRRGAVRPDLALPCHRADPALWFAESPEDLDRAKHLCTPCPIRMACLEGAVRRGEPWGVWGGEIFDQGRIIPMKRRPGRPRKHPAA
ncbi:WhiB family transcriptional regulator [Pseudonocardia ailaonensis]|uniref:WhiB family transcriptional regulator n=1 Tax=Pseudonocardia ailaonensis TaxID=367279 RepID=UPI003CD07A2F